MTWGQSRFLYIVKQLCTRVIASLSHPCLHYWREGVKEAILRYLQIGDYIISMTQNSKNAQSSRQCLIGYIIIVLQELDLSYEVHRIWQAHALCWIYQPIPSTVADRTRQNSVPNWMEKIWLRPSQRIYTCSPDTSSRARHSMYSCSPCTKPFVESSAKCLSATYQNMLNIIASMCTWFTSWFHQLRFCLESKKCSIRAEIRNLNQHLILIRKLFQSLLVIIDRYMLEIELFFDSNWLSPSQFSK